MIPYAIFCAKLEGKKFENLEVRALDMSVEGFTFRITNKYRDNIQSVNRIILHFYCFSEAGYRELILNNNELNDKEDKKFGQYAKESMRDKQFIVKEEESTEFYTIYRFLTKNPTYQDYANELTKEYMNYIKLKLQSDDAYLSEKMVGYPARLESEYAESFSDQKSEWFSHFTGNEWENVAENDYELGIVLDNPDLYEHYIEKSFSEFIQEYWIKAFCCDKALVHPLCHKKIDYLYIGNQFCHLLFPDRNTLLKMMDKAYQEKLKVVLCFTYVQEVYLEAVEVLIEEIVNWCKEHNTKIGLVVNDWGMLSILKKSGGNWFEISLGVLLCKRRKDVRMKYWHCNNNRIDKVLNNGEKEALEDNTAYIEHLNRDFGISRFSLESAQNLFAESNENELWNKIKKLVNGKVTLHLPFFQMNTSQYCTLYAQIEHNDRGSQTQIKECPCYCNDKVFLYSKALQMVGRYNSLFGYDADIMAESKRISNFLAQGIDRIVVGLL